MRVERKCFSPRGCRAWNGEGISAWTQFFSRASCDPALGDLAGGTWQSCRAAAELTHPVSPPPSLSSWDLGLSLRAGCFLPLLAPSHSGAGAGSQAWSRGRPLGRFPESAGRPLLFQKRGRKAQHLGARKPPSPPPPTLPPPVCGQKLHPVTCSPETGQLKGGGGWRQSPKSPPGTTSALCASGPNALCAHLPRLSVARERPRLSHSGPLPSGWHCKPCPVPGAGCSEDPHLDGSPNLPLSGVQKRALTPTGLKTTLGCQRLVFKLPLSVAVM